MKLSVPLIVAPMLRISGPDLVIASCNAGVVGAFPALNAASGAELDDWLARISRNSEESGVPYAVNVIAHGSNRRLADDLSVIVSHRSPLVIASVGSPENVVAAVKGYGGTVYSDVVSIRHARKAASIGVDGMVLLCAGAGGQTGWLNPFAFVEAVREFYDGALAVAGSITHGRQLAALELIGANFGYAGTAFIVANESMATEDYRAAIVRAVADDVFATRALTGIPTNVLRNSAAGVGITDDTEWASPEQKYDMRHIKLGKHVHSAGHGVGAVHREESCAAIVARFTEQYRVACAGEAAAAPRVSRQGT